MYRSRPDAFSDQIMRRCVAYSLGAHIAVFGVILPLTRTQAALHHPLSVTFLDIRTPIAKALAKTDIAQKLAPPHPAATVQPTVVPSAPPAPTKAVAPPSPKPIQPAATTPLPQVHPSPTPTSTPQTTASLRPTAPNMAQSPALLPHMAQLPSTPLLAPAAPNRVVVTPGRSTADWSGKQTLPNMGGPLPLVAANGGGVPNVPGGNGPAAATPLARGIPIGERGLQSPKDADVPLSAMPGLAGGGRSGLASDALLGAGASGTGTGRMETVFLGGGGGDANLPKALPRIGGGGGAPALFASANGDAADAVRVGSGGSGPGRGGGVGYGIGTGIGFSRGAGIGVGDGTVPVGVLHAGIGEGIGQGNGNGVGIATRGSDGGQPGPGTGTGAGFGYASGAGVGLGAGLGAAQYHPQLSGLPGGEPGGVPGAKGSGGGSAGSGPGGPGIGVAAGTIGHGNGGGSSGIGFGSGIPGGPGSGIGREHGTSPGGNSSGPGGGKVVIVVGPGGMAPGGNVHPDTAGGGGDAMMLTRGFLNGGLKGEYFDDPKKKPGDYIVLDNRPAPGQHITWHTFTTLKATRIDRRIDFHWNTHEPDALDPASPQALDFINHHMIPPILGVGPCYFSVRWTGKFYVPEADEYTFYLEDLDDGGRLWIDGSMVINAWLIQRVGTQSRPLHLAEGIHDIRVDYCQGPEWMDSIVLRWKGRNFPKEVIGPAERVRRK